MGTPQVDDIAGQRRRLLAQLATEVHAHFTSSVKPSGVAAYAYWRIVSKESRVCGTMRCVRVKA